MQCTFNPSKSGLYVALSRDGVRELCDVVVNGAGAASVLMEDGRLYPIGQVQPGRKFIGPIPMQNNPPKPQHDFKVGDLVVSLAGGPVMRVEVFDAYSASCSSPELPAGSANRYRCIDLVLVARPGTV